MTTPPQDKRIRNRYDLTFRLLRSNFEDLTDSELKEVLDYVLETPEHLLDKHEALRKRITKVFKENLHYFPKDYMEKTLEYLIWITIIDARHNFYTYVKLIAERVIPNKFQDGRHIEVICDHLQSLYESYENPEKRADRLQVFLPPRSMKSVLCSILFPSWILGKNPKYRVLLVGGNVNVVVDVFGRPLKNLIGTDEYREIFPETRVDAEAKSAQRFATTVGGGFYCAGASQGIAGRGGDFIICDDVINEQNAFSKAERTKINHNYVPGIRSRSQPGAAELIINTRWHLDDLSGFLMKTDGFLEPLTGKPSKKGCFRPWKIVSVPAILDKPAVQLLRKPSDPKDRYSEGGSYWPEYKPLDELLDLKQTYLNTEPFKWNALYMQNPVPEEGNIVKRSDWSLWDKEKPPKVSQIIVAMDTAYSEKERADYSAVTVWGVWYDTVETLNMGAQGVPQIILLAAKKGKWDFHQLCQECEELRERWKPDYFVIEKKASGIVLAQELHRRSFPLIEYDPRGKKEERLQAAAVRMKTGQVWVPLDIQATKDYQTKILKEFAEEVVEEVCNFPSAPNDDFTDTVSMAVVYLRDLGVLRDTSYEYDDEDDIDETPKSNKGSYWSALVGGY